MLRPRIIPCLLMRDQGLVKTRGFSEAKYVGDPINAVRIFNEKEADELLLLDIDASARRREPDYGIIRDVAAECRMPLCYGGGVHSADQAKRIMALGVEKVALSSAAADQPAVVSEIARQVGNQSVVAVVDVRNLPGAGARVFTLNGSRNTGRTPVEFARELVDRGAGEILIHSVDRDGMMKGYDLDLARRVRDTVSVPLTLLGGAGSLVDLKVAVQALGAVGLAAGSFFVFKGTFRAVLISYPTRSERDSLLAGFP